MGLPDLYPAQVGSPYTTLAAPYTSGEGTMTLVDATKLPTAPNIVCLAGDVAGEFSYTGKEGNVLQGVAALPGTPAATTWPAGTFAFRGISAYDLNAIHENMVRTATYVVAASDAPAHVKRQADYVCDGTDDHVEIQAAIDALPDAGGVVELSTGTFAQADVILVDSGVWLRGAGTATVLYLVDGTDRPQILNRDYTNATGGNSGIVISDLKLDGNKANNASSNPFIDYYNCPILFRYVHDSAIERNTVINAPGIGIDISYSTHINVNRNFVFDSYHDAIKIIFGSSYVNVTNNIVQGYTAGSAKGVEVQDGTSFVTVANNIIREFHGGVGVEVHPDELACSNITISGNLIDAVDHHGISLLGLSGEGQQLTDITISGNTVRNSAVYNIRVAYTSRATIDGNRVYGAGSNGIHISSGNNRDVVITGNTVESNDFGIMAYSSHTTIAGNIVASNNKYGIAFYGSDAIISDNLVKDNGQAMSTGRTGLGVLGTPTNVHIINNVVCDTGDGTQVNGIYVVAEAVDTVVRGNRIFGNTTQINNNSASTVVQQNTGYVTENKGAAASIADGGTIAHGCAAAPTTVTVSGSVAGEIVTVTSIDATNITVAIKKSDGSAGTPQTIYWRAEV